MPQSLPESLPESRARVCGHSLRDELMGMGFRIDDKANTWSGPGGRGGSLLGDFGGKIRTDAFDICWATIALFSS